MYCVCAWQLSPKQGCGVCGGVFLSEGIAILGVAMVGDNARRRARARFPPKQIGVVASVVLTHALPLVCDRGGWGECTGGAGCVFVVVVVCRVLARRRGGRHSNGARRRRRRHVVKRLDREAGAARVAERVGRLHVARVVGVGRQAAGDRQVCDGRVAGARAEARRSGASPRAARAGRAVARAADGVLRLCYVCFCCFFWGGEGVC